MGRDYTRMGAGTVLGSFKMLTSHTSSAGRAAMAVSVKLWVPHEGFAASCDGRISDA